MELNRCQSCNCFPQVNKYENAGSFYHTTVAKIWCDCGVFINIETYEDRDLDIGNGYDVQQSQFNRAMLSAKIKWNSHNKLKGRI